MKFDWDAWAIGFVSGMFTVVGIIWLVVWVNSMGWLG